jgi:hypothetical protein
VSIVLNEGYNGDNDRHMIAYYQKFDRIWGEELGRIHLNIDRRCSRERALALGLAFFTTHKLADKLVDWDLVDVPLKKRVNVGVAAPHYAKVVETGWF